MPVLFETPDIRIYVDLRAEETGQILLYGGRERKEGPRVEA